MTNALAAIMETLDLAARSASCAGICLAFAYHTAGISLAMAGVLNPIMAAGAVALSRLSVIGKSRGCKSAGSSLD